MAKLRHDWTSQEIQTIYDKPLLELVFEAQTIHRQHFNPNKIQQSTLLSIKTGDCPEDCGYCSQSAHHRTNIESHGLLSIEKVISKAQEAKENGSTRFCMGGAWREIKEDKEFEQVLEIVRQVASLSMEVCCSLGMLTSLQAKNLKQAGLTYYNHNLDTSPEYYEKVITTRTYEQRIQTLKNIREANLKVCCGGIIGMGESKKDRISLLRELAALNPHPESVPINMLVHIEGTPLNQIDPIDPLELVRTIATARILMPTSSIRLSAGRSLLSDEAQTLAFLAGANSIFVGEKLLTTPNRQPDKDAQLFAKLGLEKI